MADWEEHKNYKGYRFFHYLKKAKFDVSSKGATLESQTKCRIF